MCSRAGTSGLCSLATSGARGGTARAAAHQAPTMCAWTRSAGRRLSASVTAQSVRRSQAGTLRVHPVGCCQLRQRVAVTSAQHGHGRGARAGEVVGGDHQPAAAVAGPDAEMAPVGAAGVRQDPRQELHLPAGAAHAGVVLAGRAVQALRRRAVRGDFAALGAAERPRARCGEPGAAALRGHSSVVVFRVRPVGQAGQAAVGAEARDGRASRWRGGRGWPGDQGGGQGRRGLRVR
jgi:hypothetical protein